jgi:hypothetical protein
MNVVHVMGSERGALVLFIAERYLHRLLGLAALDELPAETGLLIPGCSSVHTFGMRFALDVLFVTVEGGSVRVHDERRSVPPRRIVRASPLARAKPALAALEVASGSPPGRIRFAA